MNGSKCWLFAELYGDEEYIVGINLNSSGEECWYWERDKEEGTTVISSQLVNGSVLISGVSYQSTVLKYYNLLIDFYDQDFTPVVGTNGKVTHIQDQLIIKFNPDALQTSFVNNTELEFAPISEAIKSNFIDSLESVIDSIVDFDSIVVSKLYPYKTYADTIDTNALGDTVAYKAHWSNLLVHFEQDIDELHIDTLLDTLFYSTIDHCCLNYCLFDRASPNDQDFTARPALYDSGSPDESIDWLEAYEGGFLDASDKVKAGIVDNGIQWKHPDFKILGGGSKIKWGANGFSNRVFRSIPKASYHGTATAGVIGARTNNSIGISGVAGGKGDGENPDYGIELIDLLGGKAVDTFKVWSAVQIACDKGYQKGVRLFNHGYSTGGVQSDDYASFRNFFRNMARLGSVNCIAIGFDLENFLFYNEGVFSHHMPSCLAADHLGLRVGSYWKDVIPGWTNTYGAQYRDNTTHSVTDVLAPGLELVYSLNHTSGYEDYGGTSAAVSLGTGCAGALMGYFFIKTGRNLLIEDVEEILERGAKDITYSGATLEGFDSYASTGYDLPSGWGQLQLGTAFKKIEHPNYTIKHFHGRSAVVKTKIATDQEITLLEPVIGLDYLKNDGSNVVYKPEFD